MKKFLRSVILKMVLAIIISVFVVFGITVGGIRLHRLNLSTRYNFNYLTGGANKVILFVADGMGDEHVKITEAYYEKEMFFKNFEKQGHISTASLNVLKSTDSASTATAFATGYKVHNKEISTLKSKELPIITEFVKRKSMGVGLVSTDTLYSQTIAAYSSHVENEENTKEIIEDQINSNVDLFLGAGRSAYSLYKEQFKDKGYSYYNNYKDIDISNKRILGVFDEQGDKNTTNTIPSLDVLTNIAVKFMEKNFPNGYLLVVECGHIDKMSHNVNVFGMVDYLENFDKAIAKTYDSLKDDKNTAIIVASNHETGGIRYNGETKDEINSMSLITYDGHTLVDVPYYIYFGSDKVNEYFLPAIIDNTDIYKICKAMLSD